MKGQIHGIHDPFGVGRLTQVRVGLSPLCEHRFRHNVFDVNDPLCLSHDSIDNTLHSMLLCQEYIVHRTILLGNVATICASYRVDCNTLNNENCLFLLYGNNAFTTSSHKDIISATIFTSTLQTDLCSCSDCCYLMLFVLFSLPFILFLFIFLSFYTFVFLLLFIYC